MLKRPSVTAASPDVAHIRLKSIFSADYALAVVVEPISGFEEVHEFILFNDNGTCDLALNKEDIGRTFFVAGQILRRERGKPVFQGSWSHDGHLTSESNFRTGREWIRRTAPE